MLVGMDACMHVCVGEGTLTFPSCSMAAEIIKMTSGKLTEENQVFIFIHQEFT